MNSFVQYAPTEVVFGRGTEDQTGAYVKKWGGNRVLIVFGEGSAVRSGLIARVERSLEAEGIEYAECGGVHPNPLLSFAQAGAQQAAAFGADLILAVGGGSAIDTAKAIAHGNAYPGVPLWDIWTGKVKLTRSTPVGVVLTIAAAGSEMSASSVLTNEAIGKKSGLSSDFNRARFAIMDPELTFTLPKYQLAAGITDIMMHTMERYFIPGIKAQLTDEISEGLLRTVIDNARIVMRDQTDYDAMAEIMWCSSISHNNLTEAGRGRDFSVHKFGHALSAMFDVTHGASLSAIWGSWALYQYDGAIPQFARYARSVWHIDEADDTRAAIAGIETTVAFFAEIGMPVNISQLMGRTLTQSEIDHLALDATMNGTVRLSRIHPLGLAEVKQIYSMANV